MKKSDFLTAFFAGVMGYSLAFMARSYAPGSQTSSATAVDIRLASAFAENKLSIGVGALFFVVCLVYRLRASRTGKIKWPAYGTVACVMILLYVIPLMLVSCLARFETMEALHVPVSLRRGEFITPSFKTPLSGKYYFRILVGPTFGPGMQGWCESDAPKEESELCKTIRRKVDFDWKVIGDDGAVLGQGRYQPLAEGGDREMIGRFQARRSNPQKIELSAITNWEDLAKANPSLSVMPGQEYWFKFAMASGYYLLFSGFVSVIGVLMLFFLFLQIVWHGLLYIASGEHRKKGV